MNEQQKIPENKNLGQILLDGSRTIKDKAIKFVSVNKSELITVVHGVAFFANLATMAIPATLDDPNLVMSNAALTLLNSSGAYLSFKK